MDKRALYMLAGLAGLLLLGSGGYMIYQDERAKQYLPTVQAAANAYGLDPNLLAKQIETESAWDPFAQSGVGAMGIAQFMPATARAYGLAVDDPPADGSTAPAGSVWNPTSAIYAMAHMMADMVKEFGSYSTALAAYNWGAGNVSHAQAKYGSNFLAFAPEETQNYVQKITGVVA